MVQWAVRVFQCRQPLQKDLLELFAGSGTFTVPLAPLFRQVWASEVMRVAGDLAEQNAYHNGLRNARMIRMKFEDVLSEIADYITPQKNGQELTSLIKDIHRSGAKFDAVLVDPPRAGLGEGMSRKLRVSPRVMYFSCNPETLARDLAVICKSHDMKCWAVFDQFPHTRHVEVSCYLEQKRKE